MKKKISIVLSLLLFIPCMLIFASCGTPETYALSLKSSDIRYGSVNHADGEYEEGTKVKIKANPLGESNFLCWVHNSNKVVSNSVEYTVTVNNETKGQYTAVFDQGCQYYVVSQVEVTEKTTEFENFTIKIETGASPTSLITVYDRNDSLLKQNQINVGVGFYNKYLISKNSLTSNFYCKLTAIINGNESFVYLQNPESVFDQDEIVIPETIAGLGKVNITFTKLNSQIVPQIMA